MHSLLRILVAVGVTLAAFAASGQTYPTKPVTIIVPFGAGSGTDAITRIVAQQLGAALKQTIVVENKPGANGVIAGNFVARAAPDGYTLFMSTNSPHSAAPSLTKNMPYDPVKDFAPISRIGSFTLIMVANPEVPVTSVQELVGYAKANPGKLSYATGNTAGIVSGATLTTWAGINMLHVPYKSVPPAITDVLAGRVQTMFVDLTPGLPHVKANKLRALASTRLKRSALLPDLPTFDEAGIKGFEVDAWAAMFAPANTPSDIVTRLNAEIRKIIADPQVKAQIANIGFEAFTSSPEELNDFVKVQLAKWTKMLKDAGVQPE
jgi:tripartite-type tricarboxylate transporter receptor subunit TctC